jgi:stage V sporulation protein AC
MKDKKTRTQERIEKRNESYNDYVEQVTPKHSCLKNCAQAFVTGGIICTVGQAVMNMYMLWNDKDTAAAWTTLTLVLISVILTALNIYPSITKWGGAGSLVPITGFANSVAAPAIEFKKEGYVFGVGCKIFTIAGPVILYGILLSWILGIIYWILIFADIIS